MKYLKLKKRGSFYDPEDCSSVDMDNLGSFLTSDKYFAKCWLSNPDLYDGGNVTFTDEKNGNILIMNLYTEDEDEAYRNAFIISKDELINFLKKLNELYKLDPAEIIITYDNDKLTLESKD